jgi:hypothetical protein
MVAVSMRAAALFLLMGPAAADSAFMKLRGSLKGLSDNAANPIRKVVTLLEAMEKKVEAEGEAELVLYKKFKCYCNTGKDNLKATIDANTAKAPQVASAIAEKEGQKTQFQEDLKQHQEDRAAAKDNMAKATAIREKEAKSFAALKVEHDTNIDALSRSIAAVSHGMAGGFLQTPSAASLRKLVPKMQMGDSDRQELMSFLSSSGGEDYVPQSGEITGILKQLKDDMEDVLKTATEDEKAAISNYNDLMSAKKKEVLALTDGIEQKSARVGELSVEIVMAKNDLTDTQQALLADQKFIADLEANCAAKAKDWDARVKMRNDELKAIAETIQILSQDDALELFKKTLPSAASSLVQVRRSVSSLRIKALDLIRNAQKTASANKMPRPDLDLIALAIQGKKVGLEKVIKMIDEMVDSLKAEQTEDDNKKEYCALQLDSTDDKKKGLERAVSDHETAIAEAEETVATLKDEIKTLKATMKEEDRSVQEASQNRKAEHIEYAELMQSNGAAKEVLDFAINRLNKFYNPKLHKPEPKQEAPTLAQVPITPHTAATNKLMMDASSYLSDPTPMKLDDSAAANELAFLQVSKGTRDDPGPAPEFDMAGNKGEESNGVIGMIKLLIKDLDKEMTIAETEEKDAQQDYEKTMQDAAEKRTLDSKSMVDNEGALAAGETELEEHKEGKASTGKELMATMQYLSSLHAECDWLMKYFDVRKEARAGEMDALKNAKAVLSGADFTF